MEPPYFHLKHQRAYVNPITGRNQIMHLFLILDFIFQSSTLVLLKMPRSEP